MQALATARPEAQLDELTVRRAQRGDDRAWRDLVDRYHRPVHALLWRMMAGRARHRVEDLAQETFARVHGALPRFELAGSATLSTWILTIATRLALNELRRPEVIATADGVEADREADAEHAVGAIDRARLGRAIAHCMAKLPDAQRAILVLREYHDLDYQEIADMLELDLGTVKSRLSRARVALRDRLVAVMPELRGLGGQS